MGLGAMLRTYEKIIEDGDGDNGLAQQMKEIDELNPDSEAFFATSKVLLMPSVVRTNLLLRSVGKHELSPPLIDISLFRLLYERIQAEQDVEKKYDVSTEVDATGKDGRGKAGGGNAGGGRGAVGERNGERTREMPRRRSSLTGRRRASLPKSTFEQLDKDMDGQITLLEFQDFVAQLPGCSAGPKEALALFRTLDKDGGGYICKEEFKNPPSVHSEADMVATLDERRRALDYIMVCYYIFQSILQSIFQSIFQSMFSLYSVYIQCMFSVCSV